MKIKYKDNKKLILSFIVCLFFLEFIPISAIADARAGLSLDALIKEEQLIGELQWLRDETFVITASKRLENIKKSAASISVVTDEQIRNIGARDLIDILRTVPGIGVSQNNIGNYEIESRGVKTYFSEKVLFMLNSHPIDINLTNGGPSSWPKLTHVAVENIKRIEIIRGPGSALYGANAFSALVNIISKNADDIDGVELTAQAGTYATQSYNLLFGNSFAGLDVSGNFNFFDTNGFKAYVPSDNQAHFDNLYGTTNASLAPGKNDPWEKRNDVELRLDYQDLELQLRYASKKSGSYFGTADALNNDSEISSYFYSTSLKYTTDISDKSELQARIYHDFMSFDNYWEIFPDGFNLGGVFPEGYNILALGKLSTFGADIQTNYEVADNNNLIFGFFAENQKQYDIENWTNYVPSTGIKYGDGTGLTDFSATQNWNGEQQRNIYAFYAEDIWDIRENFRLTSGLRYDHFSDTGSIVNPRAGFAWEFIEDYRLKLMYGEAFRAPTFAEQYNINNSIWVGNPNVKPETVKTLEVSLGADFSRSIQAKATFFHSKLADVIGFGAPNDLGTKTTQNLYNITSQGLELELKFKLNNKIDILANYTYQDVSDTDTGVQQAEVPSHKGNIMINYRLSNQVNIHADAFIKGTTSRDNKDSRFDIPTYALVNTTLIAKDVLEDLKGLEFRASIYNLLNKDYRDPSPWDANGYAPIPGDYQQAGRTFMLEMKYVF